MSSTYNNSDDCLILDLGLYPSSPEVLKALNGSSEDKKVKKLLKLDPKVMTVTDWDHVLNLVIKNKKSITL